MKLNPSLTQNVQGTSHLKNCIILLTGCALHPTAENGDRNNLLHTDDMVLLWELRMSLGFDPEWLNIVRVHVTAW